MTWRNIDKKREVKVKLLTAKSPRLSERAKEEYKTKDKGVRGLLEGKREPLLRNRQGKHAEAAAAKGELSTVYKITKELSDQSSTYLIKPA